MEAKPGLTGLMDMVVMDMVILMDIMIITGIVVMMIIIVMTDAIIVIKIITITSIRIITIKTPEATTKVPITQMIVTTGRMRNLNGSIISIIIRKIMQIPEIVIKMPIEVIHTTITGHQEAQLM